VLKKRVYLAGPIFEAKDPVSWRRHATRLFGSDWDVRDPTLFELDITDADTLIATDLAEVGTSNVVLARVDQPSWGTAMELRHAKLAGIPVVGLLQNPAKFSPWLRHHVSWIEYTIEVAVEECKRRAK
jgi:nucleoside 2-deoxyribosyltransferase